MLENWVKRDNPKARIQKSDTRIGNKYAVVIDEHSTVTPFLSLNELERFCKAFIKQMSTNVR